MNYVHAFLNDSIYNPIQILQGAGAFATAFALFFVYKQNKASKVQQFESTLFNLISLQNNILTNINKGDKDVFKDAVETLNIALGKELKDSIYQSGEWINQSFPIESLEHAKRVFESQYLPYFYRNYEEEFNHYFRNLYHILKYLHLSNLIPRNKKQFYASLVRAQLSQNQLHVWMFNAMWPNHGYPNALFLMKQYNMLDNFNEEVVNPLIWCEYFDELTENLIIPDKFRKRKWCER